MKIAVFGKKFDATFEASLNEFIQQLQLRNVELCVYGPFYKFISQQTHIRLNNPTLFETHQDVATDTDYFFTFGGDGTFLEAVRFVRDKKIPLIGINTGRLGFLANIPKDGISVSLNLLFDGKYTVDKRKLLTLSMANNPFVDFPYGLNEVSVQKSGNSIISIRTEVNGNFLHTYYTDGLIISTPTGSTAYSMSAGGPIITPDCNAIIISPIASHNLSVRPMLIPGEFTMKLFVGKWKTIFAVEQFIFCWSGNIFHIKGN